MAPGLPELVNMASTPVIKAEILRARGWVLLGLLFFIAYTAATLAPTGGNWGLHGLGYFPLWTKVLGLSWCLMLLCPPLQRRMTLWIPKPIGVLFNPRFRAWLVS